MRLGRWLGKSLLKLCIIISESLLGRKLIFFAKISILRLNSNSLGMKLGPILSMAKKVSLLYFLAAS